MHMQVSALGQPNVLKSASALLEDRGIAGMGPGDTESRRPCSHPLAMLQDGLCTKDCKALEQVTQRVLSLAQSAASFVSLYFLSHLDCYYWRQYNLSPVCMLSFSTSICHKHPQ